MYYRVRLSCLLAAASRLPCAYVTYSGLSDEMGLGKTIQGLSIAMCYRTEWPLLILTPATLRETWKTEIIKWYVLRKMQTCARASCNRNHLLIPLHFSVVRGAC